MIPNLFVSNFQSEVQQIDNANEASLCSLSVYLNNHDIVFASSMLIHIERKSRQHINKFLSKKKVIFGPIKII